MSGHFTFSALLKLVFIALLMPQIAFSTGSVKRFLEPNDSSRKMATETLFFEELPSEIIRLILAKLPKKDLISLRLINKELKDIVTPFITNLEIPGNLPSEKQAKKLLKDLSTDKFWKGKKLSESFVNLFRHAPVEALYFTGRTIHAETLPSIVPVLPIGLKRFHLGNSATGDAGAQALAFYLPKTLENLSLSENNIGDAGAQALASYLPATLENLSLSKNTIGDAGLATLLEAIPSINLNCLFISAPFSSPLREQFKNLRNRQGKILKITFNYD